MNFQFLVLSSLCFVCVSIFFCLTFRQRLSASNCLKHAWLTSRTSKQRGVSVSDSHNVDHGIECELEFTDTDSGDGKLLDEIDMDKDSEGCRCGSSPGERSSSVYSSPSDISPTPPPSSAGGTSSVASSSHNQLHPHRNYYNNNTKRPSLDLTKEHLKEFVSRWTDNPYLFDSPRGVITHVNCTSPASSDFSDNLTTTTSSASNNASSNTTTATTATTANLKHSSSKKNDNNNNASVRGTGDTTTGNSQICKSTTSIQNKSCSTCSTTTVVHGVKLGINNRSGEETALCNCTNNNGDCCNGDDSHDINCKVECGLNIVNQIRRFSQQLNEELELMKKQCGSCNAIRKYSLSDVTVNAQ